MDACKKCGKEIVDRFKLAKYCSNECKEGRGVGLPYLTVGGISELRIAADLLAKGFYVFRSMTANSPCDLIAMNGSITIRIEAATSYPSKAGVLRVPKKKGSNYIYDILALITNNGSVIEYHPPLPTISPPHWTSHSKKH